MSDKISITICGDGGCGKSSITLRLVRSQWTHEYDPTIEDSYSVTRTIDGLSYHLSLTDTAGQEEYRSLWASSNLSSDAFLLVYDLTNPSSLDTLSHYMEMIDIESEHRSEHNARLLKGDGGNWGEAERKLVKAMPVKIVAGNKCDLKSERRVSARAGLEWARSKGCGFMETSAREMVNIEETFALIVRRVTESRRHSQLHPFASPPTGPKPSALTSSSLSSYLHHTKTPLSPTTRTSLMPLTRENALKAASGTGTGTNTGSASGSASLTQLSTSSASAKSPTTSSGTSGYSGNGALVVASAKTPALLRPAAPPGGVVAERRKSPGTRLDGRVDRPPRREMGAKERRGDQEKEAEKERGREGEVVAGEEVEVTPTPGLGLGEKEKKKKKKGRTQQEKEAQPEAQPSALGKWVHGLTRLRCTVQWETDEEGGGGGVDKGKAKGRGGY